MGYSQFAALLRRSSSGKPISIVSKSTLSCTVELSSCFAAGRFCMSHVGETTSALPLCALSDAEFENRRKELHGFIEQARSVTPTSTGLRFVFCNTHKNAHSLVDFILFEQKCCSAVSYELQALPPHTDLVLQLHASGEALASLQALYRGALRTSGIAAEVEENRENAPIFPQAGKVR